MVTGTGQRAIEGEKVVVAAYQDSVVSYQQPTISDPEELLAQEFGLTKLIVQVAWRILAEDVRREVALAYRFILYNRIESRVNSLLGKVRFKRRNRNNFLSARERLTLRSVREKRRRQLVREAWSQEMLAPLDWQPSFRQMVEYVHQVHQVLGSPIPGTKVYLKRDLFTKIMETAHIPATDRIKELNLVPAHKMSNGIRHIIGCSACIQDVMVQDLIHAFKCTSQLD